MKATDNHADIDTGSLAGTDAADDVVERWPDTSTPAVYPDALDIFRSFLGKDATPRRSADRAAG